MITIAYPDGTMEEYDLDNTGDSRTLAYKMDNRMRTLKAGETIVIKGVQE
jgi:hypothetical protein